MKAIEVFISSWVLRSTFFLLKWVCVSLWVFVCISVYVWVYVYVSVFTHVCLCSCVCVETHSCHSWCVEVRGWQAELSSLLPAHGFKGIESGGQQSLVARTLNRWAVLQPRIFYVRNESLFNFLFPYIFSSPVLVGDLWILGSVE